VLSQLYRRRAMRQEEKSAGGSTARGKPEMMPFGTE
jgi:hypothetical protein